MLTWRTDLDKDHRNILDVEIAYGRSPVIRIPAATSATW